MNVPLEISYRNVDKTDSLEELIREKAAKLERVHPSISSCRVAVEKIQEHQDRGSPYHVRVDITVPPGHELYVANEHDMGNLPEDLPAIVRRVFRSARRQLRELREVQRGMVKQHPRQETAAVVDRLFPREGYGFLRDIDGRLIYFNRNSLVNEDFEALKAGMGVQFSAEVGEKGLQATTVRVVQEPPRA